MGREITKAIRDRERKIKVSLKKENEILTEMCKYLFLLIEASSSMFFYYNKKITRLEKFIKKTGVKK